MRNRGFVAAFLGLLVGAALGASAEEVSTIWQRRWVEARTLHFHTYSCGATQDVARLAGRLEQFREAYAHLAGADSVSSPPIMVVVLPDHETLRPFLPVYDGQPANLAGFFSRGSDENLIVMSLQGGGSNSLPVIYHEFAHNLLRHNDLFWPLWLQEGMAEIYSTFTVTGDHSARIGLPLPHYLAFLKEHPLMPLKELFAVKHDSPEYNERERQGVFYAESWLLTHYLMVGGVGGHAARFGQLTVLLKQGQSPEAAFVNAFRVSLPAMEAELRVYLKRTRYESVNLPVSANLLAPQSLAWRGLAPAETCFRLGDELLRVGRRAAAEPYFTQAQQLDPTGPLAAEGPGWLAAEQHKHGEAAALLEKAIERGSTNFLTHYLYAREKYRMSQKAGGVYSPLPRPEAAQIRGELLKTLAWMPNFAQAHHLLGFFELVQGEDPNAAEQHLKRAVELEPEDPAYSLTLAQSQLGDPPQVRRTLAPLLLPYVNKRVREEAVKMLRQVDGGGGETQNVKALKR